MGIGVSGLMSGLDTDSIVSQLMSVERRPVMLLQQKEAAYQAKITAIGVVKSALSDLQKSVADLKSPDGFINFDTDSSNTDILEASVDGDVQIGTYNITVQSLASEQHLRGAAFTASDTEVGTGTLTIQVGSNDAVDIEIDSEHNTLEGITQAINDADAGITAGIIYDGTHYYLTLQGHETGTDNTISITMQDDDGSSSDNAGLSAIYTDPSTQSFTETRAATNAVLTVNGIPNIERSSNTFTDLIDGISITLNEADATKPVTVTTSKNYSGLTKKLNGFIEKYNEAIDTVSKQTAYNGEGAAAGTLLGDSSISRISRSLSGMIYETVIGVDDSVNSLSKLGIEIDNDGHLSLDADKLNKAMDETPNEVISFFTSTDEGKEGFAVKLDNFLDGYLKSQTGILSSKEDGLKDSVDDIEEQIESMNIRFDKREENLRKQFLNLELMMAQFQDTAARLEQQLASISNLNTYIAKK